MPGMTTLGFRGGEDVTEFCSFLAQVRQFPFLRLLLVSFGPEVVIGGLGFKQMINGASDTCTHSHSAALRGLRAWAQCGVLWAVATNACRVSIAGHTDPSIVASK